MSGKDYKVVTEKKKGRKIYTTIMIIIITAFVTFFATTIWIYKDADTNIALKAFLTGDKSEETTAQRLKAYRTIIDDYYLGDVDEKALQEGIIKGFFEGLNDPYTRYITAEEMAEYTQDLKGEFVGIGVYITPDEESNKIKILTPIKDGAAAQAGILPGDLIRAVNVREYTAEELTKISDDLKGEEGSEVKLDIIRGDQNLSFTIKRSNVVVNPVSTEVLENNIGYIEFSSFDENTSKDFMKNYEELKKQGITSLIIDIRNNGGGIVDQAVEIAGTVLDKDSTVLYEINKKQEEKDMKTSTDPIIDVPIVVLVNENTGSASEILAGALQDYGKAKIVGVTTYGKGVIQQLLSLPDNSGLKITCAEYLTPNRNKINKVGVKPDVEVKLPEDITNTIIIEKDKDTQLQKAISILKGE